MLLKKRLRFSTVTRFTLTYARVQYKSFLNRVRSLQIKFLLKHLNYSNYKSK